MKMELHDYDIYPKVVPSGRETVINIKPLGRHAAFGAAAHISVHPLDEGVPRCYPTRPNAFEYDVTPGADGSVRLPFKFFGEQQFFIRFKDARDRDVRLSVYAVGEDLFGLVPLRGDFHMHTNRSDGRESPEIVCANYRKTGYDFMPITDHVRYYPGLEAIEAYKDAPIDLLIVPGEEVHMPNPGGERVNDVHIINFGGKYSVNALTPNAAAPEIQERPRANGVTPPPVMSNEEYWAIVDKRAETLDIPDGIEKFAYAACCVVFDEIRKAGGLGIYCHPYWIANVYQIPPQFSEYMTKTHPFDAFEVLGGENYYEQNGFQTHQYYDDRARGVNYPIVGATDAHGSVNNDHSRLCNTIVFARANETDAIIEAVKRGLTVAVDTISNEPRYVGETRLCKYACFLEKEYFPLHDDLCYEEGRAMKDYVCGVAGAKELLKALHGRVAACQAKYFGI